MRQIKRFTGNNVPDLKLGEWATDETFAFLGTGNGDYQIFQGVLDLFKEQTIAGFKLKDGQVFIPAGTPFSRIQELLHSLPKVTQRTEYNHFHLSFVFEDGGTYVNDMNGWLQIANFSYMMIWSPVSPGWSLPQGVTMSEWVAAGGASGIMTRNATIETTHAIEVYGTYIRFSGMRFNYNVGGNDDVAILGDNALLQIEKSSFQANGGDGALAVCASRAVVQDSYFESQAANTGAIANSVQDSSVLSVINCGANPLKNPRKIAANLKGSIVNVNDITKLHLLESSVGGNGGIEVLGQLYGGTQMI